MDANSELNLKDIRARGAITAMDVSRMRRAYFEDGVISPDEAEDLIELNRTCSIQDQNWPDLFIEALTDFTVHQAVPSGYITKDNADWLIDRTSVEGGVAGLNELELLVNVLDKARWSPSHLVSHVLRQVRDAVVDGSGPLASGGALEPGRIGEYEVGLLRRILYAFGGDDNIAITRAEAEILFDINDATTEADNHPSWSDLFTKAIANHLMASSGYSVPTREEALRRARWLEERDGVGGFLGKMLEGGLKGVWDVYGEQSAEEKALARLEQQRLEILTAEKITANEAQWLAERIGRDGILHENERALLNFIKEEASAIHPALKSLVDEAA